MLIKREKKDRVRLGFIGLGRRGYWMLKWTYAKFPDVDIAWLVDLDDVRLEKAQKDLEELGRPRAKQTHDYREMLADPDVDAVVIYTGWSNHTELCLEAMRAGKYTGVEVGCAYDIEQCYDLVRTYEETGSPLMMLENDCYSRMHLLATRMAREGLYGEIVHCTGAYAHYLPPCDLFKKVTNEGHVMDKENGIMDYNHYRQYEYLNRCAEQYPTHEFGPLAKLLRINRGNRLLTITSFSSKAVALEEYVREKCPADHPLQGKKFSQGDIITTVLTCANGETVRLSLDTTLPRPYQSGEWTVRGTKGCYLEEGPESRGRATIFLEGMEEPIYDNADEMTAKYEHPLWLEKVDPEAGHGGIDWLTNRAFIEAVKAGTDTPIDAYDTATWMAIGPLSERSIAEGATVSFPDFTNGKWFRREPVVECKYCLDEVCIDNTIKVNCEHVKK